MLMPIVYRQLEIVINMDLVYVRFFSYNMNSLRKFRSVFLFNKVRELHLHHGFPVTYQDRKIDNVEF